MLFSLLFVFCGVDSCKLVTVESVFAKRIILLHYTLTPGGCQNLKDINVSCPGKNKGKVLRVESKSAKIN